MQKKEQKRVFFGFEIDSFWIDLPKENKIIDEKMRHITLLFLGDVPADEITSYIDELSKLEKTSFDIGPVGYFNKCLFLPHKNPRLVAFEVDFFNKIDEIKKFQKLLLNFFNKKNIPLKEKKPFLPHVTISRGHFDKKKWEDHFKLAPLYIKSMNLYESFENSKYSTLWKEDFIKPFEEIKHTADMAFIIRGKNFVDLLYNSFIALSFKLLDFLKYIYLLRADVNNIDDVIINLNEIVTQSEIDGIFLPFKAISFHSNIIKEKNILNWEMIVDV